MVVALRLPDNAPVPTEMLVQALTERFPWVTGVIVEATVEYGEEVAK